MLFDRKINFGRSGVLQGFTDYHSHILPGVDDGVSTMEESLAILAEYEKSGISTVWCTPHIMEDMPNTTDELRSGFEKLCAAYEADRKNRECSGKAVTLNLASENMLDSVFEKRLVNNDFLPFSGNRLLVETSYFNPPMNLYGLFAKIKSAGYYPILAHPERYIYMGERDYEAIRGMGVLFQLNLFSLLGFYGDMARVKAESMLKKGYYGICGTDLHKAKVFESALESKIKVKYLQYFENL